jgi:hypothetical protein
VFESGDSKAFSFNPDTVAVGQVTLNHVWKERHTLRGNPGKHLPGWTRYKPVKMLRVEKAFRRGTAVKMDSIRAPKSKEA